MMDGMDLVNVLTDAQELYNELYELFLSESMWEAAADLAKRFPQYEARRPKSEE